MKSIRHLLTHCGNLRQGERLTILYDATTRDIGQAFSDVAVAITPTVRKIEIPLADKHGTEPPKEAVCIMCDSDLIVSLCQFSLAHTQARIDAGENGSRCLSLPGYSWELLDDPAVMCDFRQQTNTVRTLAEAFSHGVCAHIATRIGTDIEICIQSRVGNSCPGYVENPGELGSPPDIEANISPLEEYSEGRIIVDGSISCPEIGLLKTPVILTVRKGRVVAIESKNAEYVVILEAMLGKSDSPRRTLAECGVGLNPLARLTGTMLTDEGTLGCLHFGFGSNHSVGGLNKVDFHLDFVITYPDLCIDNSNIVCNGRLML